MLGEGKEILREYFKDDEFQLLSDVTLFEAISLVSDMKVFLTVVRRQMVKRHKALRELAKHPGKRWHRVRQLMAKLPTEEALVARIDVWLLQATQENDTKRE